MTLDARARSCGRVISGLEFVGANEGTDVRTAMAVERDSGSYRPGSGQEQANPARCACGDDVTASGGKLLKTVAMVLVQFAAQGVLEKVEALTEVAS